MDLDERDEFDMDDSGADYLIDGVGFADPGGRSALRTAKEYDGMIYGPSPCFSTSDLRYLAMLEEEIDRRRERSGRPLY